MQKSVHITSAYQCPRGRLDMARLLKYFEANGWEFTDDPTSADLVVAGGCAFTLPAEDRTIHSLAEMKAAMKPDAPLVVGGCITGIRGDRVVEEAHAAPMNIADGASLDKLISAEVPLSSFDDANSLNSTIEGRNYAAPDEQGGPASRVLANRMRRVLHGKPQDEPITDPGLFYIRVARGCMEDCSYCAIRLASGALRSKPLNVIVREFEKGLKEGHRSFFLMGEDVGAYGQDLGSSVVDLLAGLLDHDADFKLVISDCNPRWVIQYCSELSELLAKHPAKIRSLEVPIQSGSDRVLKLMARQYSSGDVQRCFLALREAVPSICLKTHVIVGFPGETSSDFRQTLQLLRKVRFDEVACYRYSGRPGTDANDLLDKVPESIKLYRQWRCNKEINPSIPRQNDEAVAAPASLYAR